MHDTVLSGSVEGARRVDRYESWACRADGHLTVTLCGYHHHTVQRRAGYVCIQQNTVRQVDHPAKLRTCARQELSKSVSPLLYISTGNIRVLWRDVPWGDTSAALVLHAQGRSWIETACKRMKYELQPGTQEKGNGAWFSTKRRRT